MMMGTDVMKGNGKKVVRFTVGLLTLLIVAGWSGVGTAQVLNPSFESTFPSEDLPSYSGNSCSQTHRRGLNLLG
jgi:hypothetical protein